MNKYINKYIVQFAFIARALITVIVAFTGGAVAQSVDTKKVDTAASAPASNVQTVDARQSGIWTVGIDPNGNSVKVLTSPSDPLAVKVIGSGSARKPFQARVVVQPTNNGFVSGNLLIPAGKRMVIENISAIARTPVGLKMEINFYCYLDNGSGVADISTIVFNRIALVDQGVFDGTAIASANHKVLVFADELIGTTHTQVVVQARLNGVTTEFAQGQVTFSGYLEDLPAVP
jgi:hypothetical protein